jgi:3-deoxy-D-manno-octulosonic acid kinase
MREAQIISAGQLILYDGDQIGHDVSELFRMAPSDRVAGGRGWVEFARWHGMEVAIRHYRRGGLPARLLHDCYLWWRDSATRAVREWRLLVKLRALGLPVVMPLAVRVERQLLCWRGDIVTQRIEAITLADWLQHRHLSPVIGTAIGRALRRLHDAGVNHADLNARNILLTPDGEPWIIDLDRGAIRNYDWRWWRGGWRNANLRRLRRSLTRIRRQQPGSLFDDEDWRLILQGYHQRLESDVALK